MRKICCGKPKEFILLQILINLKDFHLGQLVKVLAHKALESKHFVVHYHRIGPLEGYHKEQGRLHAEHWRAREQLCGVFNPV